MNYHQSVEDIIKTASPAQRILWNDVFLRFGENVSVSQLNYTGVLAGTPFATYNARAIYLAYSLFVSGTGAPLAIQSVSQFYNESNAQFLNLGNNAVYWDATGAALKYVAIDAELTNFYFSRFVMQNYTQFKFIGFRIGI